MVLLYVRNDVDLVENDARVEDVEGGIIQSASQDNVLEEL